jgi:dephospho-CoA kinase
MLLVGLTGGIGAGKSTVARMLEARGAVVIDADELARRAIEPDTLEFGRLMEEFGERVLAPGGEVDRDALAAVVFADPEARRRLEAIVHPGVARLFQESVEPYRSSGRIVVYSVPLLVESGLQDAFDMVVVVEAPESARIDRVMADRGMSEDAARSRMGAQASEDERRRVADVVIRNDGSPADLDRKVDRLWADLSARAAIIGRR